MMKLATLSNIRWVLILPLTLLSAFATWFILIRLSAVSMDIPPTQSQVIFWFVIGGGLTAVVWVYVSYLVAPSDKIKVIWAAYIIGLVVAIVICYPSLKSILYFAVIKPWAVACLAAALCGLLTVLFLQYKVEKDE